jgi:chromosome segregation ATPase
MKNTAVFILLAAVCVGLGIVLFTNQQRTNAKREADEQKINGLSNEWTKASMELTEQRQVNAALTNLLNETRADFSHLTNQYTALSQTLVQTEATLKQTQNAVVERDQRIAALETQNRELDEKAIDLSAALTNLSLQISDTQRQLDASEGDKEFLEKELKRLLAEKSELERQFNDLAVLRSQVSKLKEELSVARRIDWIRKGLFASSSQKGSSQLLDVRPATAAPLQATNAFDLNVEVNADGSVTVLPGLTNAPAGTP